MTARERRVRQTEAQMIGPTYFYLRDGGTMNPPYSSPDERTAERRVASYRTLVQDIIDGIDGYDDNVLPDLIAALRRPTVTDLQLIHALRSYHADVFVGRRCPECDEIIPEAKHTEDCPWGWIVGEK